MLKMVKKYSGTVLFILTFVIPVVIISLAYFGIEIYPGGPNTILTMDMGAQYMPFFASLRYIGKSDNSWLFSMAGALGNNFSGYAYYGIYSPLTWITVLFPLEQLPNVIYFITIAKIGLCGTTFCFYLWEAYSEKRHYVSILLLSCCYALMAYNIGYALNLMWIDGVIMLPLILVGIERVLKNEKATLFILSVLFSIGLNYYITFMSGVFATGYLFVRLTEERKWNFRILMRFSVSALSAIGLSSPILIPGIMALTEGKLAREAKPLISLFRYRFLDLMRQFMSGNYDTLKDDGLPLIFCGTGTIFLVLLYFIRSKDKWKIKILWLLFVLFYILALCFIPLDRIMHGFMETTCYEGRYSFSLSCLLLILAYRGVDCVSDLLGALSTGHFLRIALSIFVLGELYFNSAIILSGIMTEMHYGKLDDYERNLSKKKELVDWFDKDDEFFRVSDYDPYTYNDGAWLGYNGIGYFSSCYNIRVMNFLGALGENQAHHVLRDGMRTPVEESLLGVKYRISYFDYDEAGIEITSNEIYNLSENTSALSLGYIVDYSKQPEIPFTKNAFENQNTLARELSGNNNNVFIELKQESCEEECSKEYVKCNSMIVATVTDAPVWLYVEKLDRVICYNGKKNTSLVVNGQAMGEFIDAGSYSPRMVYLGNYKAGELIRIDMYSNIEYGRVYVNYMDVDVYQSIVDKLGKNQLILSDHGKGFFNGRIDAGEGGNMLLTLSAIDGWRISIDGKRATNHSYRDALIMIPLTAGVHDVNICFIPPGLQEGLIIEVLTIIMIVTKLFWVRRK